MKDTIIINDLSAFGNCSLNVNLAVLQSMNIQTHAIASFLLSHQSDFEDFYIANVSNHLNEILKRFKNKSIFDGFLSGYLKSEENLLSVNDFLQDFKGLKVIDPVLGDNGKFYKEFSQKQVDLYKEIIKNADVITPNITEACFLADVDYYDFYKTLTKDNIDEKLFSLSK